MSSSIEEYFQPPEWATKDEVVKAAQHYINYWKVEARMRNDQWLHALEAIDKWIKATREKDAENARLKAELHRLEEIVGSDAIDRKYGMCCDASDEIARLKSEVERLNAFTTRTIIPNEELQKQIERLTADNDQLQNRCDFLEGKQP